MNREEKLTFFTKNEFKILNKTQGLLDLSGLSLTELQSCTTSLSAYLHKIPSLL
jgi:hypothetical protein